MGKEGPNGVSRELSETPIYTKFLNKKTGAITVLLGVGFALFRAAFQGIVGDLASSAFSWIWTTGWLPWAGWIALVIAIIPFRIAVISYKTRIIESERRVASAMATIRLYDLVFQATDNLSHADNRWRAAQWLAEAVIAKSHHVFEGALLRGSVFLQHGDLLVEVASYKMPPDVDRTFYVGPDRRQRISVAGRAFLTGDLQICRCNHLSEPDFFVCDHEDYFREGDETDIPHYRSFIAVPFSIDQEYTDGVLCLDSQDPHVFDSPSTQELTTKIAGLVGSIYRLAREFEISAPHTGNHEQLNEDDLD